eukprot:5796346-Prymnesium_polylepis.1
MEITSMHDWKKRRAAKPLPPKRPSAYTFVERGRGTRRMFVYVLERLVDERLRTLGWRLHKVVYDPRHSDTALLGALMQLARFVAREPHRPMTWTPFDLPTLA